MVRRQATSGPSRQFSTTPHSELKIKSAFKGLDILTTAIFRFLDESDVEFHATVLVCVKEIFKRSGQAEGTLIAPRQRL